MFSIYFIYNDFFNDIDKIYGNNSVANVKDIKNCKGINKIYLYEIIILSVPEFLEEYNLNTVNLKEDVEEIIDKGLELKINLSTFYEKSLKNMHLIQSIFEIDKKINEYTQVLSYLNFNQD